MVKKTALIWRKNLFNYLSGKIISREKDNVIVLDINGWGVEIFSDTELYNYPEEEAKAYVLMVPSEDEIRIYGFLRQANREMFKLLRGISGLGAKSALKILSSADCTSIATAVAEEDKEFLKSLPGVGEKTADRIILELRGKLKNLVFIEKNEKEKEKGEKGEKGIDLATFHSALDGLESLGYSSDRSRIVLREIMSENKENNVQEIIKKALKKFLEYGKKNRF